MSQIKQINKELLDACIAENVDLSHIEDLLKHGAQPLGAVEWDSNLYDAVLEHYLNDEEEVFVDITELFIKYGMDIQKPELSYDGSDILNPLWSFAFFSSETGLKALKLLLDNGLDVESAGECWSHELSDWNIMKFRLEDQKDYEVFYNVIRRIMLFVSYPHIILNDKALQKEVWFTENHYDYTKFRNWNNFSYEVDTKNCKDFPQADGSVITIIENESGKKVWEFGFGISKKECMEETKEVNQLWAK